MGDQGERSPQSFLVNNFSFLQTAAKTIGALSSESRINYKAAAL